MLFLLRIMLVVGGLSYLALMRSGADPAAEARTFAAAAPRAAGPVVTAGWAAVPPETRERMARDVLARGLMAELTRRAAEPDPLPVSRDTLVAGDREPAWRGVERR